MSDRHADTPPFAIEIAPENGAVPASVEAFQAALKAERDNVLAELQASLHEQNEAYRHALRSELQSEYEKKLQEGIVNRTGDRGGFLVKVKQVPQSALQVADSIALRPQ